MAKIAVESEANGNRWATAGVGASPARYQLACGDGWTVSDVICTAGPQDRAFEEQHSRVCIAIVVSGSFQYRSSSGRELMTPGSLLLGSAGQYFICSHEHATGDRCVSFQYESEYFDRLAEVAGVKSRNPHLPLRVPPVRKLSTIVARACAGLNEFRERGDHQSNPFFFRADEFIPPSSQNAINSKSTMTDWDEIALQLAITVLDIANGIKSNRGSSLSAEARTTRVVRMIDSQPGVDHNLISLAREAKLSRYHFLRTFQELTGLTPHQYVLRARLRRVATQLISECSRVLDVALDFGFGDLSTFNHAFRREFGVSPRTYRQLAGRKP